MFNNIAAVFKNQDFPAKWMHRQDRLETINF